MKRLAIACAAVLAACGIPATSPQMDPGQDCMQCHKGDIAPLWTVSGTLFRDPASQPDAGLEDGQVLITDAAHRTLTLSTNGAGNFYTAETLQFPIRVQAQVGSRRMAMSSAVTNGSCNSCHAQPAVDDAPGRLFVAP
jgi:hypothetical protein